VLPLFRILARLKWLRGTRLDPFGRTRERRMERRLIEDYVSLVERLLPRLSPENYAAAAELAALPLKMRGFGHVKERNIEAAKVEEAALLARFEMPAELVAPAAE